MGNQTSPSKYQQPADLPPYGRLFRSPYVLQVGAVTAALVAVTVSGQTYLSMLSHGHSLWRILIWQLSAWSLWALMALPIVRMGASLSAGEGRGAGRLAGVAAVGLVAVAGHLAVAAQFAVWLQPFAPVVLYTYRQAFLQQFASMLVTDVLAYLALLLIGSAVAASDRARQLAVRESRLEAELAQAHLEALRLEIQPHFLFNTLNSIAALIRLKSNDKALEMLVGLSELMRSTLDRNGAHVVPLSAEVDLVRRYIDLQRSRFSDRLRVDYAIDPSCETVDVPAFLLQPLVENALRHGMARRVGPCHIEIAATRDAGELRVVVTDDGVGLPAGFELERHAGTGLRNISRRLDQLYGSGAALGITPGSSGGARIEITIPAASPERRERVSA